MAAPTTETNRQLTITRLLNAPRELVWKMWTEPEHIRHWWGPKGFTNTISRMDVRENGEWELVMHGPDGKNYPNKHFFKMLIPYEKIVLEHATHPHFEMSVLFEKQGDKTLLHITSTFESAEQLKQVIEVFKADIGLKQNVERLVDYIAQTTAEMEMVKDRIFHAPREKVFKAWTDVNQLAQWWGPKGFTNPVCEIDVRPGGKIRIHMKAPDGTIYPMEGEFLEIVEPERLVFVSAAINNKGEKLFEVLNIIEFIDKGDQTLLTIKASVSKVTPAAKFHLEGMDMGWSQSLDKLGTFIITS